MATHQSSAMQKANAEAGKVTDYVEEQLLDANKVSEALTHLHGDPSSSKQKEHARLKRSVLYYALQSGTVHSF